MITLFKALVKLHIITPVGLCHLLTSFYKEGITLMAVLRFTTKYYSDQCAIVSENQRYTYKEIYAASKKIAYCLFHIHGIRRNMKVGILSRNHIVSSLLIPALSRLGVHLYLLNTDMGAEKMSSLLLKIQLDFLVYDDDLKQNCLPRTLECKSVTTNVLGTQFSNLDSKADLPRIGRGGRISVLTGGSSGQYKEASRNTGVIQFLPPFFALLKDIKIQDYKSVFLALPFYHGFGLGVLIIAMVMGKKICMTRRFDTEEALDVISAEEVEVLPIVPAMLSRIWQTDNSSSRMKSVKCIICGGDRLDKKWVDETKQRVGSVLFNLYGTSEAGFFMLATPSDLEKHTETTLGRPISGVLCDVRDVNNEGVGVLWVKSKWAMIDAKNQWQSTGDRVFKDKEGFYFHRGIAKNMVVCGGENVFPESVEQVINLHPEVINSKVYPVENERFGMVLHANVELKKDSILKENDLKEWLSSKVSRPEMPHQIKFGSVGLLSTGKRTK